MVRKFGIIVVSLLLLSGCASAAPQSDDNSNPSPTESSSTEVVFTTVPEIVGLDADAAADALAEADLNAIFLLDGVDVLPDAKYKVQAQSIETDTDIPAKTPVVVTVTE